MPRYLSTDPNAGLSDKYLSTDPSGGNQEKPPPSESDVRAALDRLTTERNGRPVSDTGEPYSDLGTRVADMGASMAHPTSLADIGQLIFAGTDVTRLGSGMASGASALRDLLEGFLPSQRTVGGAIEQTGKFLQHPVRSPGRLVQEAGRRIKAGAPAPTLGPAAEAPLAAGTTARMAPSPAAEALQQSSSFRHLPSEAQIWSDVPPAATRTAAPLAEATQKVTAMAAQMKVALDPTEIEAVSRLVMEGYDPAAVLEQVARQKLPASFQGLPTNATVEATKRFPKGMRGKATGADLP